MTPLTWMLWRVEAQGRRVAARIALEAARDVGVVLLTCHYTAFGSCELRGAPEVVRILPSLLHHSFVVTLRNAPC